MFPLIILSLFVAFQVWVTWQVWRNEYFARSEKAAQTRLIWLLPLLGAVLVYSMLTDEAKHQS